MEIIEIRKSIDLNKPRVAETLSGGLYVDENQAHKFIISAVRNGESVALTGTVSGKCLIWATGQTVALTGSIVSGAAELTLAAGCYTSNSRVTITIFITVSSQTVALYQCHADVFATGTDAVLDPGTILPSVSSLIAQIEAATASVPADYSDLLAAIAPTYSNASTYAVGDYVWRNGDLYRCTTAISTAESWKAAHWTAAVVGNDVAELKSALAEKLDAPSTAGTAGQALVTDGNGGVSWADVEIEVDATLSQSGEAADAKATGDEIIELKSAIGDLYNISTLSKNDADYNARVKTSQSTPTEKTDGTRIRIIYDFSDYDAIEMTAICTYAGGIVAGIYSSLGDACKAANNPIVVTGNGSYIANETIELNLRQDGPKFLVVSQKKTDGSVITDEERASMFAALTITINAYKNKIDNITTVSWLNGKKISIIGDSIDTFNKKGYKIDGYNMYYPSLDVTNVEQTWWYQVISASGSTLEVNASWSGSRVTDTHSDPTYPDFYDRVSVIGSPDLIFVTLGTNDSSHSVALGEYDFETTYTSLSESQFRPAYIKGIKALQATYPDATIVCITEQMEEDYRESIRYIAKTLGTVFIDASDYVGSSGVHPGAYGMSQIARLVLFPTDATLSEQHIPADAKATGDKIDGIQSQVDQIIETMGQGLTEWQITALLNCFAKVAWIDENGESYYNDLRDALKYDLDKTLPAGYTKHDYVALTSAPGQSNVGGIIDTGLSGSYSSQRYEHTIIFKLLEAPYSNSNAIYGQRGTTGSEGAETGRSIWLKSGDYNIAANYVGVDTGFIAPLTVGTKYTSVTRDDEWLLNGTIIADNLSGTWTAYDNTIQLFGIMTGESTKGPTRKKAGIYGFSVFDSVEQEYVAYMIPCTNGNSVPGLYDVVRKAFYTSSDSTMLVASNDV